jgi:hypothetical protein
MSSKVMLAADCRHACDAFHIPSEVARGRFMYDDAAPAWPIATASALPSTPVQGRDFQPASAGVDIGGGRAE